MSTGIVVVTDELRAEIDKIRRYAEQPAHWYRPGAGVPPPGDDAAFVLEIPIGYRAVFSITEIDGNQYRHLSISRPGSNAVPGPYLFQMIAPLFGFSEEMDDWDIDFDQSLPGLAVVVVVQPFYGEEHAGDHSTERQHVRN